MITKKNYWKKSKWNRKEVKVKFKLKWNPFLWINWFWLELKLLVSIEIFVSVRKIFCHCTANVKPTESWTKNNIHSINQKLYKINHINHAISNILHSYNIHFYTYSFKHPFLQLHSFSIQTNTQSNNRKKSNPISIKFKNDFCCTFWNDLKSWFFDF